jgi:pyruvate kinase
MLSAETAVGRYPVEAVQMMDRVARQVEGWQWQTDGFRGLTRDDQEREPPLPQRQAVARATAGLSRDLKVRAVVVRSQHGTSAAVVSATHPQAPVVALTADPGVYRRSNLLWGVVPRLISADEFERPQSVARREVLELGLASEGQVILFVAGFGQREPTITVLTV